MTINNAPPLTAHPRAKALARTWLARLEDLEVQLEEDNIEHLANILIKSGGDDVPKDILYKNRLAILKEIHSAKNFFIRLTH